jgi:hypothetical protein
MITRAETERIQIKLVRVASSAHSNHAPFKLNGQSRTAFGLLKAPKLQRLSVTVEVLRIGVMIVGVISVGVMTVGVLRIHGLPFQVIKSSHS